IKSLRNTSERGLYRPSRKWCFTRRLPRLRSDLPREISRKISGVFLLQFPPLPVFASQRFPAIGRAAFALDRVIVVVGHRPIMGQLFSRLNVAHRDKRDLAAHPKVCVAGMIRI